MNADELPAGAMNYSFKAHVQAYGFAGDLIISSSSVNDLVKSLKLLERAGIQPTAASQPVGSPPICPVHQRPMKASKRPGSFYCSAKVGDGYCQEKPANSHRHRCHIGQGIDNVRLYKSF